MAEAHRILFVEDLEADAKLALIELERAGLTCEARRVETDAAFRSEIEAFRPHLILADFGMPRYDGLSALTLARELCPEVPFIFLSGSIGEENAVRAVRMGATDYILKDRIARLAPAVKRALVEVEGRAAARAELAEMQRRFDATFEQAAIGLAHTDLADRLQWVNAKFCEITGYAREELVGRALRTLLHPDELASVDEQKSALLERTMVPHARERRFVRRDSSAFWGSVTSSVVRDTARTPRFFVHALEDVSERRRMEEALRRAEQDYRIIFDNAVTGIFAVNVAGRVVSGNGALVRMLGFDSFEELASGIASVSRDVYVEPGARRRFREALLRDGTVERFETQWRRKDGRVIWVSMSGRLVSEQTGGTFSHIGMVEDITERKRAEADLQRFRLALDSSADMILIIDPATLRHVDVNETACRLLGYSREELLRMGPADTLPVSRADLEKAYAELVANPAPGGSGMDSYYICKDGSHLPFESTRRAVRAGDGWVIVAVSRDIRERLSAERALRERDAGLRRAQVMARLAHVVTGPDGVFQSWSSTLPELIGVAPEAVPRTTREWMARVHADDVALFRDTAIQAARERQRKKIRYRMRHGDGQWIHLRQTLEPLRDEGAEGAPRWFATMQDVTEQREAEQKIEFLAYFDPITGLANRTLFVERLEQHLKAAASASTGVALSIVDVERFKTINDTFGREAGDELLRQLGRRVARLHGDDARLARIGPDQIGILTPDVRSEDDFARLTEKRFYEVFGEPFKLGEHELRVAAKAGIALFPADGASTESLLRNAEAAVKKAKAMGERYLFYRQDMTARVAEKLALENKLRRALENDEFVLHYQPKVDGETSALVGVEALIRWQNPELGLVPPAEFIPLMEETGLILQVGTWALRRAALDHKAWAAQGLKAPRIAVNVSAIQLRQREFVSVVERAIREGLTPTAIDLEITESLVMEDVEANIAKLKALRDLGMNIAVDDFGTGYSSLGYLAKLPAHSLKIDRSFIRQMGGDSASMSLVSTIIQLAHSLRLKVVAEGVETQDQATFLRLLRCDELQGYLFGRPVPAAELASRLT